MNIKTTARLGGFFWLLTFVTGVVAMVIGRKFGADAETIAAAILERESFYRLGVVANVVATVAYIAATLFVYFVLKAVNEQLSLLSAFFSLTACAVSSVSFALQLAPIAVLKAGSNALLAHALLRAGEQATTIAFLFFGLHVLTTGVLILRSTYISRVVGALMLFGGLGWLTFAIANLLSPELARTLMPLILIPGIVGEGALTLWLLVKGVDVQRWNVANSTLVTKGI